ncbi:hypothetical protein EB796_012474 [Bugula neritina]|uniref:Uncharacterized protein n=1 Tax=Bugula neritina TaxID=10212 RepID=A0A7J7JTI9_BUGNE|nr:hypothetical protein EB796_012474 [Bugula neritina]
MNVLISALLDFLQIAEMRRLKFKGLDTSSLETLLQNFVTRFATGKPSKSCSIPTQRSVYEAMIKDGRWDTFITGLYKKVMDYLDANGDESYSTQPLTQL